MNFMEAVEAMKQGKKIRRKCWKNVDSYFKINVDKDETAIRYCDGATTEINLSHLEATDWEVVKEKKTLWDKRRPFVVSAECGGFDYDEDDVKEALKEFLDYFEVLKSSDEEIDNLRYNIITKKATEIFGKELLK